MNLDTLAQTKKSIIKTDKRANKKILATQFIIHYQLFIFFISYAAFKRLNCIFELLKLMHIQIITLLIICIENVYYK